MGRERKTTNRAYQRVSSPADSKAVLLRGPPSFGEGLDGKQQNQESGTDGGRTDIRGQTGPLVPRGDAQPWKK